MVFYFLMGLIQIQLFNVADSFPNINSLPNNGDYIEISWKELSRMQFEEKYSSEFEQLMPYPVFHKSVKALEHKKVMITGYVIPLDENPENPIFVLSAFPFSACFFCGGAGPESVIDVQPKAKLRSMEMDKRVTLRGTLTLNPDDLYNLFYILKDAELAN